MRIRGVLIESMDDPDAEILAGTRTLTWVINGAGAPTPARVGASGDTIRIPAIPGAPAALLMQVPAETANPWLMGRVQPPLGDSPSDFPTLTMEIAWNLQFG
jgi:hypothetical protein